MSPSQTTGTTTSTSPKPIVFPPRIDPGTNTPLPEPSCDSSYTTVSGKEVCKGKVVYFEQFQNTNGWGSNNNWTSEILIPRTGVSDLKSSLIIKMPLL